MGQVKAWTLAAAASAAVLLAGCGGDGHSTSGTAARGGTTTANIDGSHASDVMVARAVHSALPATADPQLGLSDAQIAEIADYDCGILPSHTLAQVLQLHAEYAEQLDPQLSWDDGPSRKFVLTARAVKCRTATWRSQGTP